MAIKPGVTTPDPVVVWEGYLDRLLSLAPANLHLGEHISIAVPPATVAFMPPLTVDVLAKLSAKYVAAGWGQVALQTGDALTFTFYFKRDAESTIDKAPKPMVH